MKLDLTLAALDDLRSIRAYTLDRWGAVQEQQYLDLLWNKFETIIRDPSKFRFREDLFAGCQIAAEGKHVILFRIKKRCSPDRESSSRRDGLQAAYPVSNPPQVLTGGAFRIDAVWPTPPPGNSSRTEF